MRELDVLAAFAATLSHDRLPPAVPRARDPGFADSVGAALGTREPDVRALADHAARVGPGPATLVGHGARVTPGLACLVHETAGVTLEMDEGHAHARGHVASGAPCTRSARGASWARPTVAAWLRRLDGRATREALELAASFAITPSFATATQGANVRNTYPGVVNKLGLLAVELHGLGFRGERGGVRTAFGEILRDAFAPEATRPFSRLPRAEAA